MRVYKKILLTFFILIMLLSLKCFATTGENITFNEITTQMPEIIQGSNDDDPLNKRITESEKNITNYDASSGLTAQVGASSENISSLISRFANETTAVGIDVSYYQETIDWKKVADSGVTFAIIRCGYRGITSGGLYQDTKFQEYIQGALDNGIYVGVYFFSAAITEEEALQEAKMTVDLIKNYDIKYPVAYDFELFENDDNRTDNLSVDQINKNALVFLNYVESCGYKATLYGSTNYLNSKWNMANISPKYDTWVAHYYVNKPTYTGKYQMWQYTDIGIVPGITKLVDVDVDYSYFASMKTSISGRAYVQNSGWQSEWKYNGATIGTTGSSLRLEQLKICLTKKVYDGTVQYRSQIQDLGWEQEWLTDNQITGQVGKRLETIQVKLTEDMATHYDVYYRVHVQDYGWLGWAKNGESAGTEGQAKRIEAIELKLVPKGGSAPGSTSNHFIRASIIKYKSYIINSGWQNYVWEGSTSGTTGLGKKIESLAIELTTNQYTGGIQYRSYVQDLGWSEYAKDGEEAGTPDSNKRLETIQVQLYGDMANYYDVYYRVHVQNVGWMGWTKNGASAGTVGQGLRIEAIQIKMVDKGGAAPGSTSNSYIRASEIKYRSYIINSGWQNYVWEGAISGSTGLGKKIEAIQIPLTLNQYSGGIQYRSHIQNIGWETEYAKDGETSGKENSGLRIEALQIQLYGDMANYYDVYYRVYVQNIGWMGWAKNGESAGTSGYSYRIEAIQVQLVNKNTNAPGSTANAYKSR